MTMKILIIDDEPAILLAMATRARRLGHDVIEAEDGQIGYEAAVDNSPDLILLDVRMPVLDGTRTLELLRGNPETSSIPVLMMSGSESDSRQARTAGANGFLSKPHTKQEFETAINRALAPEP